MQRSAHILRTALLFPALLVALSSAQAQAPAAPAPAPGSAAADNVLAMFNPAATSGRPQYHSLLFSKADMDKIYSASRTYMVNMEKLRRMAKLHGQPVPSSPQQAEQQLAPLQTLEHPQFYLELIAYREEGNWSLWLNGHQYTDKKRDFNDVHVVSVDAAKATFAWKPKIFGVYEDRLLPGAHSEQIVVNKKEETVEFTLFPNQSFSAYSMTIEEGYLPPTRVEQFTTGVHIGTDSPLILGGGGKSEDSSGGSPALPALPSAGIYDMPGKEDINKRLQLGH